MKLTTITISAFAFAMAAGSGAAVAQYVAVAHGDSLQSSYEGQYGYRDRDDDRDGDDLNARQYARFRDRGFHEGFEGARRDFENHRYFTPTNRDEYRRPDDVPREAIRVYRIAFREGYLKAQHEITEGDLR